MAQLDSYTTLIHVNEGVYTLLDNSPNTHYMFEVCVCTMADGRCPGISHLFKKKFFPFQFQIRNCYEYSTGKQLWYRHIETPFFNVNHEMLDSTSLCVCQKEKTCEKLSERSISSVPQKSPILCAMCGDRPQQPQHNKR